MTEPIVKCVYCNKEMLWHEAIEHEDECHDKQKLCGGYGVCKNKGIFIVTVGKRKSRWCMSCLKRAKEEGIIKVPDVDTVEQ